MSSVAIITARGGSKRIPRKNIKEFCGKPIIQYSIEAAIESGIFDEVMVSTDDKEIADISIQYGAKVPFFRSERTSDDYASTVDVLLEVIAQYEKTGKIFNNLCCIYPTAPFISSQILVTGMNMLDDNTDVAIPVTPFTYPPQRGLIISNDQVQFMYPNFEKARSQDIEKVYHDCGQFYCIKTEVLLREKKLFVKRTAPILLNELVVQDIDNEDDWKLAELKYMFMQQKEFNSNKS